LTTAKASADAASSAASPKAAASVCSTQPPMMPMAAATPWRQPPRSVLATV
jgi:hypothetical protein